MRYLMVLALLLQQSVVMAASFDCAKAQADIEHVICDNPELDTADSALSQQYKALRKTLSTAEKKVLKKQQRQWLKQRLKSCQVSDIDCLVELYQARTAELTSQLNGGVLSMQSANAQSSLMDFVPAGYSILDAIDGDLNRDKYMDKIVILRQDDEKEETLRPLLILTRDANNQLHLQARNDNVVLCAQCGGILGDPYQRVAIKNGYFTVEHHGGSSWRWTKYITFKYVKKQKNWYLHKVSDQSYHSGDPDNIAEQTQTKQDFGSMLFTDYRNQW